MNLEKILTTDLTKGDFTSNIAMQRASAEGKNPKDLAAEIVDELGEVEGFKKIEVAGPGFINFWLDDQTLESVFNQTHGLQFSSNSEKQTIVVEHSSPNLFKPFHIGHTMNNIIGEAIAGLYRSQNHKVITVSYPSDVSLGIAKAVWALNKRGLDELNDKTSLQEKLQFLGDCYVAGTRAYDDNEELQKTICDITTDLYEGNDSEYTTAYNIGKDITLEYFKAITHKLGSQFDKLIFESEAAVIGEELVKQNIPQIFQESQNAVIYDATDQGLHARVFINSAGYPTYEAKDLGLIKLKFDQYSPDKSIIVTDYEQSQYFKVMLAAAGEIDKSWHDKTVHIAHGRMKFQGAKMSSRLGNVPTAEEIIESIKDEVRDRSIKDISPADIETIAVGALKFVVLKSSPGSNINFDPETSLSFEGDSGPYLQYTVVRIASIVAKAQEFNLEPKLGSMQEDEVVLARLLYRYPIVLEQAQKEHAPQLLVQYLLQLSQAANSYYANHQVVNSADKVTSSHRLAIIVKISQVISAGLKVLGIKVPEKM